VFKLFGKGEWAAAKSGERGKRAWRKLHLGVDETELLGAVELTDNTVDDANVVCDLFSQDEDSIERFGADAAYCNRLVYSVVTAKGAVIVFPPSKTAVVAGGVRAAFQSHNKTVSRIGEIGKLQWKKESRCHRQIEVESAIFRYEPIFGGALRARSPATKKSKCSCPAILESNDSDRDARVGGNEPVREIQKKPRNTDWTVHASTPHEHANACYRIGGDESALLVATHREEWPRRVFQISGRLP
jgi:hypothetical protein